MVDMGTTSKLPVWLRVPDYKSSTVFLSLKHTHEQPMLPRSLSLL